MNLYAIFRRGGLHSSAELEEATARSRLVGKEDLRDDVRLIRSYVLEEGDGSHGSFCIYEATSPEAIRRHAALADLRVDKIVAVTHTFVVRGDPG
jgi:hypothetical protein